MAKTIVALYENFEHAQQAVQDLVNAGFMRENISLVANDASGAYGKYFSDADVDIVDVDDDDVSGGEGAGFGAVVGALVGLGVALIPGIGPVLAAGPLAAAVMAGIGAVAGAATGGIVASLVDFGVPEDEAHVYAEGIRRGGTLVSITADETHVSRIEDIMNRHNPIDIDERATGWRDSGWTGFDHTAEPYSASDMTAKSTMTDTSAGHAAARTGTTTGEPMNSNLDQERVVINRRIRVYEIDDDV